MKHLKLLLVVVAMAAISAAAQAAGLGARATQAGGVTIEMTPIDVAATAKEWTFAVALNTHSRALVDDLVREAFIVDGTGRPQPALGWDGDSPGGRHRKGVLRFASPSPTPAQIEVRIRRASESEARTFRWPE
jgi:hypothetical protein